VTRKPRNASRRQPVCIVQGAGAVTLLRRADKHWRGLDDYERDYRRNFLVRGAIEVRAFWATKEGFETVVEEIEEGKISQEKRDQLKQYVDSMNACVNLDNRLRLALIKAPIWSKTGFEIEFQKRDMPWAAGNEPVALRSLKSMLLVPEVDLDKWQLMGFEYNGKKNFYKPDQLLFFVRNETGDDWQGISDIEPILTESMLDDRIVREDLMEAATTLWAGIAVHQLDLEKAAKAGITDDADIDQHFRVVLSFGTISMLSQDDESMARLALVPPVAPFESVFRFWRLTY